MHAIVLPSDQVNVLERDFLQAFNLHKEGRLDEAERLLAGIIRQRSDHPGALHLLGVCRYLRGDHEAAINLIAEALRFNPGAPYAWNSIGSAYRSLHRLSDALAAYDNAILLKPDFAAAHGNRALVLQELGRLDDAIASCDQAIACKVAYPAIHNARGEALYGLHRHDEALASLDQAIAFRPDFAEAHANRGNALQELGRYEEALASYDRALGVDGKFAEALNNRANTLRKLGRFDEALKDYQCAIELKPDQADAHSNRGLTLRELGRIDEALACFRKAIALDPNYVSAHWSLAFSLLMTGDHEAGWKEFEWRRKVSPASAARTFAQPLWLGESALAGTTILLHAEQGLGDTLQFCRYVPMAVAAGARVILEVPPPLTALLASLGAGVSVVAAGEPLPDFDCHCPLMSLPLAFKTRADTIPDRVPYLFPDPARVAAWQARLGAAIRPRVGLVWSGNPKQLVDGQRSLRFDQLAPLLAIDDVEFHSLQLGDEAIAQLRAHPLRERVVDHSGELDDFADTAALVEHLDLMISVDTSVVHLAGALGKPFWLLNRFNTCWRWLLERDDSPWYPTARIFRQPSFGDWDSVMTGVAAALAGWMRDQRG